jgi:hypothetical protein
MSATMQVAYYRMRGRFDSTYESAMTKHFLGGRTETIRPVTAESCALARAWVCALLHAGAYVGSLSCPRLSAVNHAVRVRAILHSCECSRAAPAIHRRRVASRPQYVQRQYLLGRLPSGNKWPQEQC